MPPHKGRLQWHDVDLGEFGAAETADGRLRLVSEEEAREVGLLDGSYRQCLGSEHLQEVLDAEG